MKPYALLIALAASAPTVLSAAATEPVQTVTRAAAQQSFAGPEQYFTGNVRVDMLFDPNEHNHESGAYVTFQPGARSAWHTHPKGQRLVVTAGSGYTQEWGKPKQAIGPGDVVWCPPGVKHWHGAAPGSSMTHLALTASDEHGKNVEWLEKVSDAQYHSH
ncbi:cupin domain-containing protein [Uruburuella testudinis]|uniref:Cupin domain-containing protein n=1 Tax=Uruburuella testudinis TaxID=1282863 RepID=A0ABY4DPV5_9NEIS|nr:cupin domain-containing protein [Uruburuella testudinis]UOO81080.1 cupin domain-containing protein [Uruburuella testudinis]